MNLLLNEKIYKSSDISPYGIAAYCAVKSFVNNNKTSKVCVTPELLAYQLTENLDFPRRFKDGIKAGLQELINLSWVKLVNSRGSYFVLDCSEWFIPENNKHFTIIGYDEILKIFQIQNINNFMVLKYFIFLMSTISSKIEVSDGSYQHKRRVVGRFTIEVLSQLSGISLRSIIEYNKILENADLIYIYRQKDFMISKESGEISCLSNIYGRAKDKEYIDAYAHSLQKYKKTYQYSQSIDLVNQKRRLAQMYNQLCKGNDKKYSKNDILDIYAYVVSENQKYQELYKQNNDKFLLKKIRDEHIFKQYDFIHEKMV